MGECGGEVVAADGLRAAEQAGCRLTPEITGKPVRAFRLIDGFGGTMTKKGSRKMKVFLGGTCNESDWRNRIIPMLEVGFFNPVVDDWTPDCMAEELRQREECDVCLYVITPKMTGVYSVAEVIDDSNKRPARTVFVRLRDDGDEKFTDGQWKSLGAVAQMVERNGGTAFDSLKSAALHINAQLA